MQNNFSKNLKVLRAAKGMTLKDVYEATGITDGTMNNYESGRGYPSLYNLVKLAELFGLSLDEIVFGDFVLELKRNGN